MVSSRSVGIPPKLAFEIRVREFLSDKIDALLAAFVAGPWAVCPQHWVLLLGGNGYHFPEDRFVCYLLGFHRIQKATSPRMSATQNRPTRPRRTYKMLFCFMSRVFFFLNFGGAENSLGKQHPRPQAVILYGTTKLRVARVGRIGISYRSKFRFNCHKV